MSTRHTAVVSICVAALLLASLAFLLTVPVAVERTAYGDDPDLSLALTSPELLAWQRAKADKLVEIAEIYAAVELGDREVQQRFPGLTHPAEGNSTALGASTDPAEILDEAILLDPANLKATLFLSELCIRRDARGALSRPRQAWLLRTLDGLAVRPFTSTERPRLIGLTRMIETILADAPADRLAVIRAWWSTRGPAFLAHLESAAADAR